MNSHALAAWRQRLAPEWALHIVGLGVAISLLGDLTLWYAQDYPAATDDCRVIDVRTAEEFSIWHLPGAENVPLATIRDACDAWDRDKPIRLYCSVGFRSYLAYRVLVQKVPTSSGYTINHTATVFLMDAEGRFVGSLSFQEPPETQITKLRRLVGGQ